MAFEVTRKENGPKKDYSDYIIHYIFNDEIIYNISVKDFIEKVEPHIWTSNQINDFCGFDEVNDDDEDINKFNNSTDSNSQNKKKDKAKKVYKILMIIFIILSVILLASTIFLALKLSNTSVPPMANITNSFDKV